MCVCVVVVCVCGSCVVGFNKVLSVCVCGTGECVVVVCVMW